MAICKSQSQCHPLKLALLGVALSLSRNPLCSTCSVFVGLTQHRLVTTRANSHVLSQLQCSQASCRSALPWLPVISSAHTCLIIAQQYRVVHQLPPLLPLLRPL